MATPSETHLKPTTTPSATHETSTETLGHTIKHSQTHHYTHEPITPTPYPPTKFKPISQPTKPTHHTKTQQPQITKPRIQSHLIKSDPRIRSHLLSMSSTHESILTSWPWVRPTNLISSLNHNLRTTKHKQRHRRERREKREVREEIEGRRVYVCYYVLCVCDLVNV